MFHFRNAGFAAGLTTNMQAVIVAKFSLTGSFYDHHCMHMLHAKFYEGINTHGYSRSFYYAQHHCETLHNAIECSTAFPDQLKDAMH
jgi:hypothetical protein